MVGAILFAFLAGVALGVVLGRRSASTPAAADAFGPAAPTGRRTKPSKRAMKAGLTDESFTPADDILDKLRKAAEGELDPAELTHDEPPAPDPAQVERDRQQAERERRVLERLRQQQAQASDFSNERDSGENR